MSPSRDDIFDQNKGKSGHTLGDIRILCEGYDACKEDGLEVEFMDHVLRELGQGAIRKTRQQGGESRDQKAQQS